MTPNEKAMRPPPVSERLTDTDRNVPEKPSLNNPAGGGSHQRIVRRRQAFVDCLTESGWRKGSIAWPLADAEIVAAGFREEHPNWLVEINPIEGTP